MTSASTVLKNPVARLVQQISCYESVEEFVRQNAPDMPTVCLRPEVIERTAARFIAAFPGEVMYAVKCNDDQLVLDALRQGGIRNWDVASADEIAKLGSAFPEDSCHFMHPIKPVEVIRDAYRHYGIRSFAVDHPDEVAKIASVIDNPAGVTLLTRIAVPHGEAKMSLAGKFGAKPDRAGDLLRLTLDLGFRTGLTFHVGSQSTTPVDFEKAVALCGDIMRHAGVELDVLDVGGGFPASYSGNEPDIETFASRIGSAIRGAGIGGHCKIKCEPGRALVADGLSIVTRVTRRGDGIVHLNDGFYGNLSEMKYLGPVFRINRIRTSPVSLAGDGEAGREAFDLFGPTCDSLDHLPGPHMLPGDVTAGDWLEITQMGAYSTVLRTGFNGLSATRTVRIADRQADHAMAESRWECAVKRTEQLAEAG